MAPGRRLLSPQEFGFSLTRTAIIVSPYFPPASLAGVHRARLLAKHLPACGWDPVVVCVDARHYAQSLDPALAALVPPSVETAKVGALPAGLSRAIGVGDIGLRAWGALAAAATRLVRARPAPVALITGSPFYPMLMAGRLRAAGAPVVLDFQDPWVSAWGAAQPRRSKAGLSHRLARLLEPRALGGASFVTSVSQTQNRQMAERYRWLDPSRMAAIPIGGDPDDFDAVRATDAGRRDDLLDPGAINLSFVGAFMPRSGPVAEVLFRALRRLRSEEPELANRIRLNFVGTSNQPDDHSLFQALPLARRHGVADCVREFPARVPYLEALGALARSDGVLLIGSDEPHYTASKIYPALMCGRPWLSLFHRDSSAHAILRAAGGGVALSFATQADLEAVETDVAGALRRIARAPHSLGRPDAAAWKDFHARSVAEHYAAIFERLRPEAVARHSSRAATAALRAP